MQQEQGHRAQIGEHLSEAKAKDKEVWLCFPTTYMYSAY